MRYCSLKAYNYCKYFWGRKINLSGISPAKRSRSGPNSVYVDMSRSDTVQKILGAISPCWAKWRLGRVPQSSSFFVCGNPEDLSVTSQRPNFHQIWSRNVVRCSVAESVKTFSKLFTLGVICPQNLKSKIGQTGTSLTAGYRS